jgi:hypothetical protein
MRALLLVIALACCAGPGSEQATSVSEPSRSLLQTFVRPWSRASALGDLIAKPMPRGALELRFWDGFGFTGTRGRVLRRDDKGNWTAEQADVQPCLMPVADSVTVTPRFVDSLYALAQQSCPEAEHDVPSIPVARVTLGPLPLPRDPATVWQALVAAGIRRLPPEFNRSPVTDGYH